MLKNADTVSFFEPIECLQRVNINSVEQLFCSIGFSF